MAMGTVYIYRCRELILKLTNTLGKEQNVENRNRVEAWR